MTIYAPTQAWVFHHDDDMFVEERGGGGGRGGGGVGAAVLWMQGTTYIAIPGTLEVSHLIPHTLYYAL